MSGNVPESQSSEFMKSIDLRPYGIPYDHLIKLWKHRVSASVGKNLGELNDLRIVMSQSPRAPKFWSSPSTSCLVSTVVITPKIQKGQT